MVHPALRLRRPDMCTLKCQALRNELSIQTGEREHRDSSVEAPPRTLTNLLETWMIERLEMILCVSSKVLRYQLGKAGVDELTGMQCVLQALQADARLDRTDLPLPVMDQLMFFIRGPWVNDMLTHIYVF